MGPDWWIEAQLACEEEYGAKWDEMDIDQQARAIEDYVLDEADALRDVQKESGA
jgi:hypothetical protein